MAERDDERRATERAETEHPANPPQSVVDPKVDLRRTDAARVVGMWYWVGPVVLLLVVFAVGVYYWADEGVGEDPSLASPVGTVGGQIVGEVLLGLLQADPASYLSVEPRWRPQPPFATNGHFTIVDLLQFAGVV